MRAAFIVGVMGCALMSCARAGETGLTLEWQRLPDLPDTLGRKGMYAGVSAGHVVLAGGSNFPVLQRAGGTKQFHRDVFVRPLNAPLSTPWRKLASELPGPLGEGASISTSVGVVCVGGNNGVRETAEVFVLNYDPATGELVRAALPSLPTKAAFMAAAEVEGWLYVTGGLNSRGSLRTCWRLNLSRALASSKKEKWQTLASPPGEARYGGFLVATETADGPRLLFGGGIGRPARSQIDYMRDVATYDPAANRWRRAATLPRGAVGGAAIALDGGGVLILGGSDGHDFQRMRELGEDYRLPNDVLRYHTATDRWTVAGTMPLGLTSAAVIKTETGWILAGGEYAPGFRTASVHELRIKEK